MIIDNTTNPVEASTSTPPEPSRFFDDETFKRLIHLQEEIFKATETKIALRKLVNLILTEENLNHLKETLLKQLSSLNYP